MSFNSKIWWKRFKLIAIKSSEIQIKKFQSLKNILSRVIVQGFKIKFSLNIIFTLTQYFDR